MEEEIPVWEERGAAGEHTQSTDKAEWMEPHRVDATSAPHSIENLMTEGEWQHNLFVN